MITSSMREHLERLKAEETTRAARFISRDKKNKTKWAVCPYCEQVWLTSVKGGGMIVAGANRHVKACAKKHGVEL